MASLQLMAWHVVTHTMPFPLYWPFAISLFFLLSTSTKSWHRRISPVSSVAVGTPMTRLSTDIAATTTRTSLATSVARRTGLCPSSVDPLDRLLRLLPLHHNHRLLLQHLLLLHLHEHHHHHHHHLPRRPPRRHPRRHQRSVSGFRTRTFCLG